MQSLPLSCIVVEQLFWLLLLRFLDTSACFLYFFREFQGQGWNQPRGIEVSNLYRNAVWALQAGNSGEALTFKHYTHKWGLGIKVIFSSDLHLSFGCKFAEFESCPQLLFRQKAPRCLGPNPWQILVCFDGQTLVILSNLRSYYIGHLGESEGKIVTDNLGEINNLCIEYCICSIEH